MTSLRTGSNFAAFGFADFAAADFAATGLADFAGGLAFLSRVLRGAFDTGFGAGLLAAFFTGALALGPAFGAGFTAGFLAPGLAEVLGLEADLVEREGLGMWLVVRKGGGRGRTWKPNWPPDPAPKTPERCD